MQAFSIKFVLGMCLTCVSALRLVCDAVHIFILITRIHRDYSKSCGLHALDNAALSAELVARHGPRAPAHTRSLDRASEFVLNTQAQLDWICAG